MEGSSSSTKSRAGYTIETKKKACELYEQLGNYTKVAQIIGVDRSMISKWVKIKDQLNESCGSKKRIKGGGRKASFPELESAIYDWLCEIRTQNKVVNFKIIKIKAVQLFREFYPDLDPFKASNSWMRNFVNRYNLSVQKSRKGRKLEKNKQDQDDQKEKLIQYLLNMQGFINEMLHQLSNNNENISQDVNVNNQVDGDDDDDMFDFDNLDILKENDQDD